jgi:hypothetical protein
MRVCTALLCLFACLAAPALAGRAEPAACVDCVYQREPAELFVPAEALGPDWEIVSEAPVDPQDDPDMRGAGVRSATTLHYTRAVRGGAQVCSLEIWSFASGAEARRTRAGIDHAGWRIAVQGNLLVMLHGVTLERGQGFRPGLLPACHRLAELTEARAEALLRQAGPRRTR